MKRQYQVDQDNSKYCVINEISGVKGCNVAEEKYRNNRVTNHLIIKLFKKNK